jgi:hypothetical protein
MFGRKQLTISQNGDCSRDSNVRIVKHSPLSQCDVSTELSMEKNQLQIMVSSTDYSSFKRLVIICTEKGWGRPAILQEKLLQPGTAFSKPTKLK